jgi:hypothetical protein
VGDQIRFRHEKPLPVIGTEIIEVRFNLPYIIEDAVPAGVAFNPKPFDREP